MLRVCLLLGALLLGACGRPLTDNEAQMARDIFGEEIDTEQVRIAKDFGFVPPPRSATVKLQRAKLREDPCTRQPTPPRTEAPPGFAIGNTVFLREGFYQADAGLFWPEAFVVPQSFVFAHEMVHVWQWQNRDKTGYSPLRAVGEALPGRDAYYFESTEGFRFEDFGFEQQASIVEDYLCHAYLDPANPRRAELRAVLAPVLPIGELDEKIDAIRR